MSVFITWVIQCGAVVLLLSGEWVLFIFRPKTWIKCFYNMLLFKLWILRFLPRLFHFLAANNLQPNKLNMHSVKKTRSESIDPDDNDDYDDVWYENTRIMRLVNYQYWNKLFSHFDTITDMTDRQKTDPTEWPITLYICTHYAATEYMCSTRETFGNIIVEVALTFNIRETVHLLLAN